MHGFVLKLVYLNLVFSSMYGINRAYKTKHIIGKRRITAQNILLK